MFEDKHVKSWGPYSLQLPVLPLFPRVSFLGSMGSEQFSLIVKRGTVK